MTFEDRKPEQTGPTCATCGKVFDRVAPAQIYCGLRCQRVALKLPARSWEAVVEQAQQPLAPPARRGRPVTSRARLWTERELDLLRETEHLRGPEVQAALSRAGFTRSLRAVEQARRQLSGPPSSQAAGPTTTGN